MQACEKVITERDELTLQTTKLSQENVNLVKELKALDEENDKIKLASEKELANKTKMLAQTQLELDHVREKHKDLEQRSSQGSSFAESMADIIHSQYKNEIENVQRAHDHEKTKLASANKQLANREQTIKDLEAQLHAARLNGDEKLRELRRKESQRNGMSSERIHIKLKSTIDQTQLLRSNQRDLLRQTQSSLSMMKLFVFDNVATEIVRIVSKLETDSKKVRECDDTLGTEMKQELEQQYKYLAELNVKIIVLQTSLEEAENNYKRSQAYIEEVESERDQAITTKQELEHLNLKLKSECDTLNRALLQVQTNVDSSADLIIKHEHRNNELEAVVKDANDRERSVKQELANLMLEHDSLENEIATKNLDIESLQARVTQLMSDYQSLSEDKDSGVAKLQKRCNELQEHATGLEKKCLDLAKVQSQLDSESQHVSKLTTEINSVREAESKLSSERQRLLQELSELRTQCEQANQHVEHSKDEILRRDNTIQNLEQTLSRALSKSSQFESELNSERQQVEQLSADHATLTSTLKSVQIELDRVTSELRSQIQELSLHKQTLVSKLEQTLQQLSDEQQHILLLGSTHQEATEKLMQQHEQQQKDNELVLSQLHEQHRAEIASRNLTAEHVQVQHEQQLSALSAELSNAKLTIEQREAAVLDLQSKLKTSQNETVERDSIIQETINQHNLTVQQREEQIKECETLIEQLHSQSEQKKHVIKQLEIEAVAKEDTIVDLNKRVTDLELDIQTQQATISEQSIAQTNLASELSNVQKQITDALQRAEEERKQLEADKQQAIDRCEQLTVELNEHVTRITSMTNQLELRSQNASELEINLANALETVRSNELALDEKNLKIQQLNQSIQDNQTQLATLQEQLSALGQEKQALEAVSEQDQAKIQELSASNSLNADKCTELTQQVVQQELLISEHVSTIAKLETERDVARLGEQQLDGDTKRLAEHLSESQQALETSKLENATLWTQIDQITKGFEEKRVTYDQQIQELHSQIESLSLIKQTNEDSITQFEEQVRTLQASLNDLTLKHEADMNGNSDRIQQLTMEICTLRDESQSLQVQIQEATNQVELLSSEKNDMQVKNDALAKEFTSLEQLVQEKDVLIDTINQDKDALTKQLVSKGDKVNELDQLVQSYVSEVRSLKEKIAVLEKRTAELTEAADQQVLNDKIDQLESTHQSDLNEINTLNGTIKSMKREHTVLEKQIQSLKEDLKSKTVEYEQLQATVQSLGQLLESSQQANNEAKKEIEKIRQSVVQPETVPTVATSMEPVATPLVIPTRRSRRNRSNNFNDTERVVGRKRKGLFDNDATQSSHVNDENVSSIIIDVEEHDEPSSVKNEPVFSSTIGSPDRQHISKKIRSTDGSTTPRGTNTESTDGSTTPRGSAKNFFSKLLKGTKTRSSRAQMVRDMLSDTTDDTASSTSPKQTLEMTSTNISNPPSPSKHNSTDMPLSPLDINSNQVSSLDLGGIGLKLNKKSARRARPARRRINVHEDDDPSEQ